MIIVFRGRLAAMPSLDAPRLCHFHVRRYMGQRNKLGDYEPENERPVNSVANILATGATGATGELVTLKWSAGKRGVYPHISRKGWSKGLFVKLNQILSQWTFESN